METSTASAAAAAAAAAADTVCKRKIDDEITSQDYVEQMKQMGKRLKGNFTKRSGVDWNNIKFTDSVLYEHSGFADLLCTKMRKAKYPDHYIQIFRHILSFESFIHPYQLMKILGAALKYKLDPYLLMLVNKEVWISIAQSFDQVMSYAVKSPTFGHWIMWINATNESDSTSVWSRIELFAYPFQDAKAVMLEESDVNLAEVIKSRDRLQMTDEEIQRASVILPNVLINVETPDLTRLTIHRVRRHIRWSDFIHVIMLDPEVYRPYSKKINNCQQYVQRILGKFGVEVPTAILSDSVAHHLRQVEEVTSNSSSTKSGGGGGAAAAASTVTVILGAGKSS